LPSARHPRRKLKPDRLSPLAKSELAAAVESELKLKVDRNGFKGTFHDSMKKLVTACIVLGSAISALAEFQGYLPRPYLSSEDQSRFREEPYNKAEPGILPAAAYIERAKQAVRTQYKDVHFNMFSDGIISHRFYSNAPAADRDIICVAFVYRDVILGRGNSGFPDAYGPFKRVILALIRKDLSKIYVNQIYLRYD
jgi:hypothetical protein